MSLGVSQIRITLNFQQRFGKTAVRLVHPDQLCSIRRELTTDFHAESLEVLDTASREF